MADNASPNPQFLAPPAVTALRQEARNINPKMTRSVSEDMREEREDLKEAAEQTLNIIVDLDLEGRIKWVSPSWRQVVGSAPESVEGRMISELLLGNKDVFRDAIEAMKEDDSRSRFIRFAVPMGPDSVLKYAPEPRPTKTEDRTADEKSEDTIEPSQAEGEDKQNVLTMEGQGIMVYERTDDEAGHVRGPRDSIDLPAMTCLVINAFGITDYVDASTFYRAARSHDRPTPSSSGVIGHWSRSSGELPDDTGRGCSERTRSLETSCSDPSSLPHLRTPDYAMVVREAFGSLPSGTPSRDGCPGCPGKS